MSWREADAADLTRLWPAARAAGVARSPEGFVRLAHGNPWAVRVSDSGRAIVLRPWRAEGAALAMRAAWVPQAGVADAVREAAAVARAHGYAELVSPLVSATEFDAYARAGFDASEPIVALQASTRGAIAALEKRGATSARTRDGSPETRSPAGSPVIRTATPADVDRIARLDEVSFSAFWRYGTAEVAEVLETERVRVAERGGEIVGYATCAAHGATASLGRLATDPRLRRRGVGRMLLLDAAVWAREQQIAGLVLCTQQANRAARLLYEGAGFTGRGEDLVIATMQVGEGRTGARHVR